MKLPCITIHNPHATLIADNLKTIETRSHNRFGLLTGKRIGIHASLKHCKRFALNVDWFPWEEFDAKEQEVFMRWDRVADRPSGLIATAHVASFGMLDSRHSKKSCLRLEDCSGVWGLRLTDIHKLATPIPIKGRQGIWYYDI